MFDRVLDVTRFANWGPAHTHLLRKERKKKTSSGFIRDNGLKTRCR
jgi:hypothetical protein